MTGKVSTLESNEKLWRKLIFWVFINKKVLWKKYSSHLTYRQLTGSETPTILMKNAMLIDEKTVFFLLVLAF